jgi:lysophospholipase L1-like esterase
MNTYDFNLLRLSRILPILGLAACLFSAASCADHRPGQSRHRTSARAPVPVTITWAMAERFGPRYDRNRNGRPDLPNSREYVNPGRYEVRLSAAVAAPAVATSGMSCDWTIDGPDQATRLRATGPETDVRLPQATYAVTVTVRFADGRTGSARETIRVKDILITVLGDSLATGEGNPEVPACWKGTRAAAGGAPVRSHIDPSTPAGWADGGPDGDQPRVTPAGTLLPANLTHSVAHRSTQSALAQLAMRLEAQDPHTSVTFVCLAASGARIDDGIISVKSARNKARDTEPRLPAQLDELHAIAGSRQADILFLSVGLNDAGAFKLLAELMRREIQCVDPLRLLAVYPTRKDWKAARPADIAALVDPTKRSWLSGLKADARRTALDQDASLIFDLAEMAAGGLKKAREQLERLTTAIAKDPLLARAEIYLMEYPDPTGYVGGATDQTVLNDLVPGKQVNGRELALVRERLLRPLMTMLRGVAASQSWIYVDGIFASFHSHGYAATDSWFVKAKESELLQGPIVTVMGYLCGEISPGTLHPNRRGQQVIADQLYQRLGARRTSQFGDEQELSLGLFRSDKTHNGETDVFRRQSPVFAEPTGGYTGNPPMRFRSPDGVNSEELRAPHEIQKIDQ